MVVRITGKRMYLWRAVDHAALPLALEHVRAAAKAGRELPDQQESGHAEAIRSMHAHVKAASAYLESYRANMPFTDPQAESEDDPNPTILSPEGRQTRAQAAVMLLAGGATVEAARLVRSTTKRPPRGRK